MLAGTVVRMTTAKPNLRQTYREPLVVIGLSALVLAIYAQAASFQFINLDDSYYVYENPAILSGLNWESIKWSFSAYYAGNWHPLTWLSLQLDVQLFGAAPGMHHVVNVILHLLNTLLGFVVFRRMTGRFWASAFIAALFAIHPAHVESVAWISERKDLLCTMFWLLSMWSYVLWYDGGGKPWTAMYFVSLAMFALGLMSKPMIITLPFVLLLCDIWPLNWTFETKTSHLKLIVEKTPFFALSIVSAIVTIAAQRSAGAVESLNVLPLEIRIKNSILSYVRYIWMAFVPNGLAVWYPYDKNLGLAEVAGAAALLVAITAACVWQFGQRKYLLIGWLWFVGALVPVIGLVQVGGQSMADRYTYIPYFGLFIIIVFGAGELFERYKTDNRIVTVAASSVIIVLSVVSYSQVSRWRNNESLYSHSLSVTRNNFLVEQNFCYSLMKENRLEDAEQLCRASLEHRPQFYEALNTLGIIQFKRADYAGAEKLFGEAVIADRSYPMTYSNLAQALVLQGKPEAGEASLQKAVEMSGSSVSPSVFVDPLKTLVEEYVKQGKFEKAVENLRRLRYLQPNSVDIRMKLIDLLSKLKKFDEAKVEVETVLKNDPNNAEAWNMLGVILIESGKKNEAVDALNNAIKLRPDFEDAKNNLNQARK